MKIGKLLTLFAFCLLASKAAADITLKATYTDKKGFRDIHHEIGLFKKINGEWMYSVGNVKPMTVVREGAKIGRNDPCPCGSGKKYKKCCGA